MLPSLILVAALGTPKPTPSPAPETMRRTAPLEPNHATIEGTQSLLQTSGQNWSKSSGVTSQLSGMYEFQASPTLRLANTLHWERLSSHYATAYQGTWTPWQFSFNEYDDELDVELGRAYYPVGVGVGYFDYNPVYDSGSQYDLAGFGVGVDRWPNFNVQRSYYASAWYYPTVKGSQPGAGTYGMLRADAGFNVRFSLVSPWSLRVGVQDESWFAKNAYASDTGFVGPYVSLSYWR